MAPLLRCLPTPIHRQRRLSVGRCILRIIIILNDAALELSRGRLNKSNSRFIYDIHVYMHARFLVYPSTLSRCSRFRFGSLGSWDNHKAFVLVIPRTRFLLVDSKLQLLYSRRPLSVEPPHYMY